MTFSLAYDFILKVYDTNVKLKASTDHQVMLQMLHVQ